MGSRFTMQRRRGRVGRFLNVMNAAASYPWTAISLQSRAQYMAALEAASVDQDVALFASFLAGLGGQLRQPAPRAGRCNLA